MLDYTLALTRLMEDLTRRVQDLSFIDMSRILVFARFGRSVSPGAYATCHALTPTASDPTFYYWRDRRTGRLIRRSQWFVSRSPQVQIGSRAIDYLISFTLPRFCDQTVARAGKQQYYGRAEAWLCRLDTVVHELYHVDPGWNGLRRLPRADGRPSTRTHGPAFSAAVHRMVREYLDSRPDPGTTAFLHDDFKTLVGRHGDLVGTAFRGFPAFPQRYIDVLHDRPVEVEPGVRVQPLGPSRSRTRFTAADLCLRSFSRTGSRAYSTRRAPANRSAQ